MDPPESLPFEGDNMVTAPGSDNQLLRDCYAQAKTRVAELSVPPNMGMATKVNIQKGCRVYSALATLLYASISISSADSLEKYIKKSACQLPPSVFDLQEWETVLDIARDRRGNLKKTYNTIISTQKDNINYMVHAVDRVNTAFNGDIAEIKSMCCQQDETMAAYSSAVKEIILPKFQQNLDLYATLLAQEKSGRSEENQIAADSILKLQGEIKELIRRHAEDKEGDRLDHEQKVEAMKNQFESERHTTGKAHGAAMAAQTVLLNSRHDKAMAANTEQLNLCHDKAMADNTEQLNLCHDRAIAANTELLNDRHDKAMAAAIEKLHNEDASEMAAAVAANTAQLNKKHDDAMTLKIIELNNQHSAATAKLAKEHESVLAAKTEALNKQHRATMMASDKKHGAEMNANANKDHEELIAAVAELELKHAASMTQNTQSLKAAHVKEMAVMQKKHEEALKDGMMELSQSHVTAIKELEELLQKTSSETGGGDEKLIEALDSLAEHQEELSNQALLHANEKMAMKEEISKLKRQASQLVEEKSLEYRVSRSFVKMVLSKWASDPLSPVITPGLSLVPSRDVYDGSVGQFDIESVTSVARDISSATIINVYGYLGITVDNAKEEDNAICHGAAEAVVGAAVIGAVSDIISHEAVPESCDNSGVMEKANGAAENSVETVPYNGGQSQRITIADDAEVSTTIPDDAEVSTTIPDDAEVSTTIPDDAEVSAPPVPDLSPSPLTLNLQELGEEISAGHVNTDCVSKIPLDTGNNRVSALPSNTSFEKRENELLFAAELSESSMLAELNKSVVVMSTDTNTDVLSLPENVVKDLEVDEVQRQEDPNSCYAASPRLYSSTHVTARTLEKAINKIIMNNQQLSPSPYDGEVDANSSSVSSENEVPQEVVAKQHAVNDTAITFESLRLLQEARYDVELVKGKMLATVLDVCTNQNLRPDYIQGCVQNAENYAALIRKESDANADMCEELLSMMPINEYSTDADNSNVQSTAGTDNSSLLNQMDDESLSAMTSNAVDTQYGSASEDFCGFPSSDLASIALEAVAVGFITKERLKEMCDVESEDGVLQSILMATLGTVQGETGWYACQDMLFYFCLHQDNFLVLCGPITKVLYDVAYDDLLAHEEKDSLQLSTMPLELHIDHLALQATRSQIQQLIDTVRIRDSELASTRCALENLQNDQDRKSCEHQSQIEELRANLSNIQTQLEAAKSSQTVTSSPRSTPRLKTSAIDVESELVVLNVKEKPVPKVTLTNPKKAVVGSDI